MTPKQRLKIERNLPTGYKDDADAMGDADLRAQIVLAEAHLRETARAAEADATLQAAKAILGDLQGAYRDARKAQQAKIAYALLRLDELGKPPI